MANASQKKSPHYLKRLKTESLDGQWIDGAKVQKEMEKTNINSDNSTSPQNSFQASDAI